MFHNNMQMIGPATTQNTNRWWVMVEGWMVFCLNAHSETIIVVVDDITTTTTIICNNFHPSVCTDKYNDLQFNAPRQPASPSSIVSTSSFPFDTLRQHTIRGRERFKRDQLKCNWYPGHTDKFLFCLRSQSIEPIYKR